MCAVSIQGFLCSLALKRTDEKCDQTPHLNHSTPPTLYHGAPHNVSQYSSHRLCSVPPICIAALYSWKSTWGLGPRKQLKSKPGSDNQESPQQTKPRKRPKRGKVHEFRPFFVNSGVFFLGKQARFTSNFGSNLTPVKSSWTGLSLVWFAGVTPVSKKGSLRKGSFHWKDL